VTFQGVGPTEVGVEMRGLCRKAWHFEEGARTKVEVAGHVNLVSLGFGVSDAIHPHISWSHEGAPCLPYFLQNTLEARCWGTRVGKSWSWGSGQGLAHCSFLIEVSL
jgi:hypothetical protein